MVLSQGLRLTLAGIVAGLAIALAMNRLLATLLFGVGPSDPITMARRRRADDWRRVDRLLSAREVRHARRSDDRPARRLNCPD